MHAPNTRSRLGRIATALGVAAGLVLLAAPAQAQLIPGFVENRGQEDPRVAFTAQTAHGTVYVTHAREIVYVVPEPDDILATAPELSRPRQTRGKTDPGPSSADSTWLGGATAGDRVALRDVRAHRDRPAPRRLLALYETVLGAGAEEIRGLDRQPTAVQYFIGNDPAGWLVDVPVYARLDLGEVAPGIRLGLHLRNRGVEKVFTVAPGASLAALWLRLEGAAGIERGPTGQLELLTDTGRLAFTRPEAWQVDDTGRRAPVSVGYDVAEDTYGFVTGPYDPSRPLIIDPLMASTYFGGAWDDAALDIAADPAHDVYVLLDINSSDFPSVPGSFDPVFTHWDTAVALLDPELTAMHALTYLGGMSEDQASRLARLPDGRVAVVGWTGSEDFPVTQGAFQTSWGGELGSIELFLAVLSRDLRHLRAATYLGGTRDEEAFALAAADNGDIVVTGRTDSQNFPTTPAAYRPNDPDTGWEHYDAFLARLSPDLTTLVASTYFGGTDYDSAKTLAIDRTGELVVAGVTYSRDLPLTPGAFDSTARGPKEGFVSRFDPNLTTLVASSYFGGLNNDDILAIALTKYGDVWLSGAVIDGGIPVTPDAFSTTGQPAIQPFVAGLSADLTTLLAASYLHDPGHGCGIAAGLPALVAVDPVDDTVVVAGTAWTDGFPVPEDAFQPEHLPLPYYDDAGFVVRLSQNLGSVEAATYLGHTDTRDEVAAGRVLDDGSVALVGETGYLFPTRPSSFQPHSIGRREGFAAILSRDLRADPPACNTGDADADGRITAADAQRVWALALGFDRPEAFERCRADCNADGRISAGDAQGVHAAALGAGSCVDALPPQ